MEIICNRLFTLDNVPQYPHSNKNKTTLNNYKRKFKNFFYDIDLNKSDNENYWKHLDLSDFPKETQHFYKRHFYDFKYVDGKFVYLYHDKFFRITSLIKTKNTKLINDFFDEIKTKVVFFTLLKIAHDKWKRIDIMPKKVIPFKLTNRNYDIPISVTAYFDKNEEECMAVNLNIDHELFYYSYDKKGNAIKHERKFIFNNTYDTLSHNNLLRSINETWKMDYFNFTETSDDVKPLMDKCEFDDPNALIHKQPERKKEIHKLCFNCEHYNFCYKTPLEKQLSYLADTSKILHNHNNPKNY